MKVVQFLILVCVFASGTGLAVASERMAAPASAPQQNSQQAQVVMPAPRGIVRQDLFDRTNPNNMRPDWPAPPAQPGGLR